LFRGWLGKGDPIKESLNKRIKLGSIYHVDPTDTSVEPLPIFELSEKINIM